MSPAVLAEVVDEPGSVLDHVLLTVDLTVDHTEGVLLEPVLTVLAHGGNMGSEVLLQQFVISASAVGASDGIDPEGDLLEAGPLEENIDNADV